MNNIDELHFASKCIIINDENKFLILKRTNYSNNGPDKWDFLRGSVDLDEDVNESIKREVNEKFQIELEEEKKREKLQGQRMERQRGDIEAMKKALQEMEKFMGKMIEKKRNYPNA